MTEIVTYNYKLNGQDKEVTFITADTQTVKTPSNEVKIWNILSKDGQPFRLEEIQQFFNDFKAQLSTTSKRRVKIVAQGPNRWMTIKNFRDKTVNLKTYEEYFNANGNGSIDETKFMNNINAFSVHIFKDNEEVLVDDDNEIEV